MRCRALLAFGLFVVAACGAPFKSEQVFRTAPNPTGCYAQLFSGDQFTGTGDYVNGPWRIADLRADRRWKDGVRSLRTGPSTTVRLWSDDNYRGSQVRLVANDSNVQVSNALGAAAASLQISCN